MYHESYPAIFTAIGFPCDQYDGDYRWNDNPPSKTVITAIETLPTTTDAFIVADVAKLNLSAPHIASLQAYQAKLKQGVRQTRYKDEADTLLAEALFDSVRTDGKKIDLKDSAWALSVQKIKADIPL